MNISGFGAAEDVHLILIIIRKEVLTITVVTKAFLQWWPKEIKTGESGSLDNLIICF